MARIKLVVDSTVDLPQEIYQQYDITVLPMMVNFGEESYRDGVDITKSEFFAKLKEFKGFPTTSQINPGMFMKAYRELAKDADVILSIHVSTKLSGTADSARMAALDVEDDVKVIVYDTGSVSLGAGFQVLEAARAIEAGCELDEVLRRLDSVRETNRIYFSVPSLEHLQKGGRIGKASALLGGLLNIVPLLTVEDGVVTPFEKLRGKKRIIPRMVELLNDRIQEWGIDGIKVAVLHTDNEAGANEMVEAINSEFGINDLIVGELGPAIGVHTGTGVIAIVYYKK